MRRLLISFLLLFCSGSGYALCAGNYVNVFPNPGAIAQNSIFLITFSEKDYNFKSIIHQFSFFAVTSSGKKVALTVKETHFSTDFGQLLLTHKGRFCKGDSVSIIFEVPPTLQSNQMLPHFRVFLDQKWHVTLLLDRKRPLWKTSNWSYSTSKTREFSSQPGHWVTFQTDITDNSFEMLRRTITGSYYYLLPLMFKITIESYTFYAPMDAIENAKPVRYSFGISNGGCGNFFPLMEEHSYSARVQLMDAAGNFSRKAVQLNFSTYPSNSQK